MALNDQGCETRVKQCWESVCRLSQRPRRIRHHHRVGRLLLNLLASLAEFELELIRERVTAGMERARKEGKAIGRPKGIDPQKQAHMARVLPLLQSGAVSWRQAAQKSGVALSTLQRYAHQQTSADESEFA